jgi:hypothetical protein
MAIPIGQRDRAQRLLFPNACGTPSERERWEISRKLQALRQRTRHSADFEHLMRRAEALTHQVDVLNGRRPPVPASSRRLAVDIAESAQSTGHSSDISWDRTSIANGSLAKGPSESRPPVESPPLPCPLSGAVPESAPGATRSQVGNLRNKIAGRPSRLSSQ